MRMSAFRSYLTHGTFGRWAVFRRPRILVRMAKRHWAMSNAEQTCVGVAAAGTRYRTGRRQMGLMALAHAMAAALTDDPVGYDGEALF
jgi:hypothetical protein